MKRAASSRLKLEHDDDCCVSLPHEVDGEADVVLPASATVLSFVTLPCRINANVFARLNGMFLSRSPILGAGLVPSISSGGIRYPRRLNIYPFLFRAGGMVW